MRKQKEDNNKENKGESIEIPIVTMRDAIDQEMTVDPSEETIEEINLNVVKEEERTEELAMNSLLRAMPSVPLDLFLMFLWKIFW